MLLKLQSSNMLIIITIMQRMLRTLNYRPTTCFEQKVIFNLIIH